METQIEFRGKKYKFVGDSAIECHCLSNGHKCNQRNMEIVGGEYPFNDNPFIGGNSINEGYICQRVWKEVDNLNF